MSMFEASRTLWTSRMLSVLRIVAGLMFFSVGTMKVLGYPPSIAGTLEMVGGLAIILGLMTRPMAFVLAGEMAIAYFTVHLPLSPFPTLNNGQPAVLYCFLFLYLTFAGAGAWSIDAVLLRSKMQKRRKAMQTPVQLDAEARRRLHTRPMLIR